MNVLKNIFNKKKKDGAPPAGAQQPTAGSPVTHASLSASDFITDKVSKDDFDSLKLLGKGSFAKVVLVRKKENGKIYAMKVIVKESVLQHQRVQDVFTERGVLQRSNHPFLCKLHWTFQSEHKLFFIMDYYHGGDLDGYLNKQPNKKLKPGVARLYAAEVLLALMYLHENGIIYRDLKPENILMGADGHPCLSDFGLSKDFGAFSLDDDSRTASFVGSPFYVAPDVLRQKQYTSAIDWWSFGILLFRMLVSRPPFLGRSMKEVFDNILYQELRFSQSNPISPEAMDLISKLLVKDPVKRAKGDVVKKHKYWDGLDWDVVYSKKVAPDGWVPPAPLQIDEPDASPSSSAVNAQAIAATPANQGPLGHSEQKLFDGFTFTADPEFVKNSSTNGRSQDKK
ncbi:RAC family serine/threonine-protein kinase-like protein [Diplonema papillatum]|nr:RAC family serine/threonine-protein kinase-like protein [Diplonema papillatum]